MLIGLGGRTKNQKRGAELPHETTERGGKSQNDQVITGRGKRVAIRGIIVQGSRGKSQSVQQLLNTKKGRGATIRNVNLLENGTAALAGMVTVLYEVNGAAIGAVGTKSVAVRVEAICVKVKAAALKAGRRDIVMRVKVVLGVKREVMKIRAAETRVIGTKVKVVPRVERRAIKRKIVLPRVKGRAFEMRAAVVPRAEKKTTGMKVAAVLKAEIGVIETKVGIKATANLAVQMSATKEVLALTIVAR